LNRDSANSQMKVILHGHAELIELFAEWSYGAPKAAALDAPGAGTGQGQPTRVATTSTPASFLGKGNAERSFDSADEVADGVGNKARFGGALTGAGFGGALSKGGKQPFGALSGDNSHQNIPMASAAAPKPGGGQSAFGLMTGIGGGALLAVPGAAKINQKSSGWAIDGSGGGEELKAFDDEGQLGPLSKEQAAPLMDKLKNLKLPTCSLGEGATKADQEEWLKWLRDTEFGEQGLWRVREVLEATSLLRNNFWGEMEKNNVKRINNDLEKIQAHEKSLERLKERYNKVIAREHQVGVSFPSLTTIQI
jgi:hypothetical protein